MTVCAVYEEDHGVICLAKDCHVTIKYLFDSHWINKYTEICIFPVPWSDYFKDMTLEECLGEAWVDKLETYSIEDLNIIFDGLFRFEEKEVLGA